MSAPENKENKKKGFLAFFSRFLGGSSSASGGMGSGGAASASGLGGIFASKAGIVGMVLGGATIAAGVGVVYNFIGPSSKPVYSPDLFEKQYYEDQADKAGEQRVVDSKGAVSESSSLDYFREQVGNDFSSSENDYDGESTPFPEEEQNAASSYNTEAERKGKASASNMPRLKKAAGLSPSSAGSKSKLSSKGGMFGGIGSKFQSVYRPSLKKGKASPMKGALASRVSGSSKYSVPAYNRKGAYGQAKYASKIGAQAEYSSSDAGAKTTAVEAFEGETAGTGDIGTPNMGAGLGGAGISGGNKLKGNDPSLNISEYTPPKPPAPSEDSPWKKYENMSLYAMLSAGGLILVSMVLSKKARALAALGPAGAASAVIWFKSAMVAAYAAIAAALIVIYSGLKMITEFGQKWMGGMYIALGVFLVYQSYKAIAGLKSSLTTAKAEVEAAKLAATNSAAGEGIKATKQTTIGDYTGEQATLGDYSK